MPVKIKAISSFYSKTDMNKGNLSTDEVWSKALLPKQHDSSAELNKFIHNIVPTSPTDSYDTRGNGIGKVLDTDKMTLKELHLMCLAEKQKGRRQLSKHSKIDIMLSEESENESFSEVQVKVEEPDLSETLISLRRKPVRRSMHKGTKARKISLSDSPSSVILDDTTTIPSCIKEMESDNKKCIIETSTNGKNYMAEALHSSVQSSDSEQKAAFLYSKSNELNVTKEVCLSKSDSEKDKVADGSTVSGNNIQSQVGLPFDTLPNIPEDVETKTKKLEDKGTSEFLKDFSHIVILKPKTRSLQQHNESADSGAECKYEDLISKQQHKGQLLCVTNMECDVSTEVLPDEKCFKSRNAEANFPGDDVTYGHTVRASHHFSLPEDGQDNPEDGQNNQRETNEVCILDRSDCKSASPELETYVGSNVTKCHEDESEIMARMNLLAMTGRKTLPSSTLETKIESSKPTELVSSSSTNGGCSTAANGFQACDDHIEIIDKKYQELDHIQINHASKACDPDTENSDRTHGIASVDHVHNVCIIPCDRKLMDARNVRCIGNRNVLVDDLSAEITQRDQCNPLSLYKGFTSTTNVDVADGGCPHIGSKMVQSIDDHGVDYEPVVADCFNIDNKMVQSVDDCGADYEPVVANCFNMADCLKMGDGQHKFQGMSCEYSNLPTSLPLTTDESPGTVSSFTPHCANIGEILHYKDSHEQNAGESFDSHEHMRSPWPPKKLPSNRKMLHPPSEASLLQTMATEEFRESMQYYRNRRRFSFERHLDNSSVTDPKEDEPRSSPETITTKLKNTYVSKGILKPAIKSRGCNLQESLLSSSHSQDAIKFSQRQMHDIDCVTEKLISTVKSMKDILEEALALEEFSSTHLKSTAEKMMAAVENAGAIETTTQKYMSMMNRDFKRFCKIMRSKGNDSCGRADGVSKKRKKITFADEAGGLLCHVRLFEDFSVVGSWDGLTRASIEL